MLYIKALEMHRSIVEWLCSKHVTKTGNFCIHQPSRISTSLVLFSPVALVSILKISSIEHLPPIHPRGGGRETKSFGRETKLVCNALQSSVYYFSYPKSQLTPWPPGDDNPDSSFLIILLSSFSSVSSFIR